MAVRLVKDREGEPTSAQTRYYVRSDSLLRRYEAAAREPVEALGDSVNFDMNLMEMNRFYFAELDGQPYLYRKVSYHEVEVYGLAE